MMPLTECSSKSREMSWMASFGPYQADILSTCTFADTSSPPHGPHPDHGAGSDADAQHQEDEDEGRAPGRAVLCEGGAHCESIHLRRQGRDRLIEPVEEVVVPRGGHDQRGRFPSDAGDAEEGPGDERARARREDDPKDGPVSGDASGQAGLPRGRRASATHSKVAPLMMKSNHRRRVSRSTGNFIPPPPPPAGTGRR